MREPARRCSASAAAPSEAARLLLLLVLVLLGCAGHAVGASVCDTAICGKGNCSETPPMAPLLPNYECRCDPGWSNALNLFPFSPCIVPNCSFNSACLDISLKPPPPTDPPTLINVCSVVSCGAGGTCTPQGDPLSFRYTCQCHDGYANLLNITTLPCVNCFLGDACYALGLGPPPPAPPPVPARPAPPPSSGDNGPPEPSSPPSGTKGSVSSPSLLQLLLLLVSVAVVQVV